MIHEAAGFKTKKAALEWCAGLLKQAGRVSEDNSQRLHILLEFHPNIDEIRGCGVEHFTVAAAAYGTHCLHVVRKDRTTTHFSYKKCFGASAGQHARTNFNLAARQAVGPETLEFRRQAYQEGTPRCVYSGVLVGIEDCHVAHVEPSFHQIVSEFLKENPEAPDMVKALDEGGGVLMEPWLSRFREFHRQRAQLGISLASENLKRAYEARG